MPTEGTEVVLLGGGGGRGGGGGGLQALLLSESMVAVMKGHGRFGINHSKRKLIGELSLGHHRCVYRLEVWFKDTCTDWKMAMASNSNSITVQHYNNTI